ncbi:MAG: hypothetical protein ACYTBV_20585, partial [Planctomycetota bacterium]
TSTTYNLFCQDCKSVFYVTLTPISNRKQANKHDPSDDEKFKSKKCSHALTAIAPTSGSGNCFSL